MASIAKQILKESELSAPDTTKSLRGALTPEEIHSAGISSDKYLKAFRLSYLQAVKTGQITSRNDALDFLDDFSNMMATGVKLSYYLAWRREAVALNIKAEGLLEDCKQKVSTENEGLDLSGISLKVTSAFTLQGKVLKVQKDLAKNAGLENALGSSRHVLSTSGGYFTDREGAYLDSEKSVYLVYQNAASLDTKQLAGLITHELRHAAQTIKYPEYFKAIDDLVTALYALQIDKNPQSIDWFQDISKSIAARQVWLEQHAEAVVSASHLQSQVFSQPALADVLFRTDNGVCIPVSLREIKEVIHDITSFAQRFTEKNSLNFSFY